MDQLAQRARGAAKGLAGLSSKVKDEALQEMALSLERGGELLLEANRLDLEAARQKGLSSAMLDRLTLNPKRLSDMARGLREVAALPDPVGEVVKMWKRPNGLLIGKMRVPLGVIGIIYESRPNVTADAAGLCLKAGNAVILRGGSEAFLSNRAIVTLLREALDRIGVSPETLQFVDTTDREAVLELLKLDRYIDLIVPRGGPELIRMVAESSTIPVVKHDKGLCHIYVDREADLAMAEEIVYNAKVQRPGVCNAMETLLVHREVAEAFLPRMAGRLLKAGVELRGCPVTCRLIPQAQEATEEDWDTEYLDLILSVKVVEEIQEALDHISRYSSMLSEAIVTQNYGRAMRFIREVDSAAVYVNSSTRFTDGGEFGLGAELGISTQKLHVRGPMGLEDLTSMKYIIFGEGQIRE
ncbi:MAG: glutamate-5-semialdehyde dehydrogenase [Nitrospinae bacterium]|nr:glutamate-5-semialdehyde dehydrogenase [Nitrospinota bacterium]